MSCESHELRPVELIERVQNFLSGKTEEVLTAKEIHKELGLEIPSKEMGHEERRLYYEPTKATISLLAETDSGIDVFALDEAKWRITAQ